MTLLTKHADNTNTWGNDVRALLGGYNATRTMYADDPHPGVTLTASASAAFARKILVRF